MAAPAASTVQDAIRIAATFTVEPLTEPLAHWLDRLALPARIELAPYNQVFQQLLNPASELRSNTRGANVVWLRADDLAGEAASDRQWLDAVARAVDELALALAAAAKSSPVPWVVIVGPHVRRVDDERVVAIERSLEHQLSSAHNVHVIDHRAIQRRYPVSQWHDAEADRFGHVPYTRAGFAAVATTLARHLTALRASPRKVIVLDCDNTLWGGVCGEDGVAGVRLDPPFLALQRFMVAQKDAGRLLCLASKNSEADALAVFDERSDMVLKRGDLVSWRINWSAKADNLIELAAELGLGLDSFVFIDDNPVECAEVRARCPGVLTLELPRQIADIPAFLDHVWSFDQLQVTEADRQRTQSYQVAVQRDRLRGQSASLAEFIAGLGLRIDTQRAAAADVTRVAQLSQRTNQFNSTTLRLTEAEVRQRMSSPRHAVLTVRVADRFGDYGLVGVALTETGADALRVQGLLLSCRALGRGVEHHIVAQLGALAQRAGVPAVELEFRPSARNLPARTFLESLGAEVLAGDTTVFRLDAGRAAALVFEPAGAAADSAQDAGVTASTATWPQPIEIARIAAGARTVDEILASIDAATRPRPELSAAYVPPRSRRERDIAAIWREVLHLSSVGTRDRFSELGGSSIQLVRVHGLLLERLGVDVDITTMFQHPTVAELAAALDDSTSARLGGVAARAAHMRRALIKHNELEGLQRAKEAMRG